jgi:hypothetical protein
MAKRKGELSMTRRFGVIILSLCVLFGPQLSRVMAQTCLGDANATATTVFVSFPKCPPKGLAADSVEIDIGGNTYSLSVDPSDPSRFFAILPSNRPVVIARARLTARSMNARMQCNVAPADAYYKGTSCVVVFEVPCEPLWSLTVAATKPTKQVDFSFYKLAGHTAGSCGAKVRTPAEIAAEQRRTTSTIVGVALSETVVIIVPDNSGARVPVPIDKAQLANLGDRTTLRNVVLSGQGGFNTPSSRIARAALATKLTDLELSVTK